MDTLDSGPKKVTPIGFGEKNISTEKTGEERYSRRRGEGTLQEPQEKTKNKPEETEETAEDQKKQRTGDQGQIISIVV